MKTPKFLQTLLKSKQETDEVIEEKNKEEEIEKSFDDALDGLEEIIKGESDDDGDGEDVQKAKKGKKKKMPYPEEEDDDEIENAKKSLGDVSAEDDIFVDAEPIIKSLMDEVKTLISGIGERLETVEAIQKAQAGVAVSQGRLLKSLKVVGDTPQERKSHIDTNGKTFEKSETDEAKKGKTLEKSEANARLQSLIKSSKIMPREVAIIEGRIQQGRELPPIMFEGFDDVAPASEE